MEEYIECTECHNIVKYENGIDHPDCGNARLLQSIAKDALEKLN